MSSAAEMHTVDTVSYRGKDVKIKPVKLHYVENIIHIQEAEHFSSRTNKYCAPGLIIVTNKRIIFSPTNYKVHLPGKIWSRDLEQVNDIYIKRKKSTGTDIALSLIPGLPTYAMLPAFLLFKQFCIELSDGSKEYFMPTNKWNNGSVLSLDIIKKSKVETIVGELRTAIINARVSTTYKQKAEQDGAALTELRPGGMKSAISDAPSKNIEERDSSYTKSEAFRQKIVQQEEDGWRIKEDGSTEVIVYKPSYGSLLGHGVVALLTIWWTLGLGNAAYAAYKYFINPSTKTIRDDAPNRSPSGTTIQSGSHPAIESNTATSPFEPPFQKQLSPPATNPGAKQASESTPLSRGAPPKPTQRQAAAAGNGEPAEDRSGRSSNSGGDFAQVLNSETMELLTTIAKEHPKSIKETAHLANRPTREVSMNLNELESQGVIKFEKHGSGKRPVIQHGELSGENHHNEDRLAAFVPTERIERLQTLREKGAISDDEFERMKANLLGET